jgi:hypothetical protein
MTEESPVRDPLRRTHETTGCFLRVEIIVRCYLETKGQHRAHPFRHTDLASQRGQYVTEGYVGLVSLFSTETGKPLAIFLMAALGRRNECTGGKTFRPQKCHLKRRRPSLVEQIS